MNERLKITIRDRADRHNADSDPHNIEWGTQVWIYLDLVKDGHVRELAHMWHVIFRVAELCAGICGSFRDHRKTYILFPVVHVSKLIRVVKFTDRPNSGLMVENGNRVDFDESLLPEIVRRSIWMLMNTKWRIFWIRHLNVRLVMVGYINTIWCGGRRTVI